MYKNIDFITKSFEYASGSGTPASLQFTGEIQGRIAHVLLAKDSPIQGLLEATYFQNFEVIEKVSSEILEKLQENPATNKEVISRIQERLQNIKQLQGTTSEQLKERVVKTILEIEDPQELEVAIKNFLFYGGLIWEIPKYVLEKTTIRGTENFKISPTEFRTLFEKTCNAVRIARKFIQEREFSTAQSTYHIFRQSFGLDNESWALHYLQQILIEKSEAQLGLSKPIYFSDPSLFQIACSYGLSSFARLHHEFNGSLPIPPSILLSFSKNLVKEHLGVEGIDSIWNLLEENMNLSGWSLEDRKQLFHNILLLSSPDLISKENFEKYILKLLKATPELKGELTVCLQKACMLDLPELLDYLIFDCKCQDLAKPMDFSANNRNKTIFTYILEKKSYQCISMFSKKEISFKNQLGSMALKLYSDTTSFDAYSVCCTIDEMKPLELKESFTQHFGEFSDLIWPLMEDVSTIKNEGLRREKLNWLLSVLDKSKKYNIPLNEMKANFPLIESLLNYRNPKERVKITEFFFTLYSKDNESLDNWKEVRNSLAPSANTKKKQVWFIPALLLVPFLPKTMPTKDKTYLSFLQRRNEMFDGKRAQSLCQLLLILKEHIEPRAASNWLIRSFEEKDKDQRLKNWELLKTLCNIGIGKQLETLGSFPECHQLLKDHFVKTFDITNIENLEEKYEKSIGSSRNPIALYIYQGNIAKGLPLEEYQAVAPLLNDFVTGILEETYPNIRYNNNKHLETVFKGQSQLFEEWRNGDKKKAKDLFEEAGITQQPGNAKQSLDPDWDVVDTDNDQDMLLMGEIQGSCQSLTYAANKSVCLVNYLMDGKIRMVAVKDSEGKIIGRCVLRVMWDKKNEKPVLYREKLYVNNANEHVQKLIKAECLQRAKALNLTLVAKDDLSTEKKHPRYPSTVESLGSRSIEYVDAIGGPSDGPYRINDIYIVYQP